MIISPSFQVFTAVDFKAWFQVKLVPVLASFTPEMLRGVTTGTNCTNYRIIVRGMGKVVTAIPQQRLQATVDVLLKYLKDSADVINQKVCRQGIESDAQWIEENLGPFSQYATYSELKFFNLSQVAILDSLSSGQKAEFLLEPDNLSNSSLVITVLERFTASASLQDLESFFNVFADGLSKPNQTAVSPSVRDSILNLTITALVPNFYMLNSDGIAKWFQVYLPLFLPSANSATFEIIPRNISCSSYQNIVKGFDNIIIQLSEEQKQQVLRFGLDYLKVQLSSGFSCVNSGGDTNNRDWLEENFGQFRLQASFQDFLSLKKDFKGAEVADLLTFSQLKELAAIPSQLNGTQDVTNIMSVIQPSDFAAFFDSLSTAVKAQPANYTQEVKSAFLNVLFERGDLSSVSDKDFLQWLMRLEPLLVDLSPNLVNQVFGFAANRSCTTRQEMINMLDTIQISNSTKAEIYKNILLLLRDPETLKCYDGGSFYLFLKNSFLSFGFPDVSTFISLLPPNRKSELLNTISPSELHEFLSQPDVIDKDSDICVIFSNYNNTAAFLQTEDLPNSVRRIILPCVWPLALSSENGSEVDLWFDVRLKNYLSFLTKDLLNFTVVQNASCLSFQRLVSFMGNNFTYNSSEFGREDVYRTIRSYLRAGSGARCYDPRDPELNSTSWFFNYIGSFVTFITLDDLTSFVSTSQLNVFLGDKANLELFTDPAIPQNVTDYYILQLFQFNPSFQLMILPGILLCSPEIPSSAFASLNEAETMVILDKLKIFCNGSENPERSAALASNIQNITEQTFQDLGSASSGLTTTQILSVSPTVLVSSLSSLGSVETWGQDQANIIVQSITSSGFQINTTASLVSLGTLIAGVPSESVEKMSASEAITASKNPAIVSNMQKAPKVVQQTFVRKIISGFSSPSEVVKNVPDSLATEIPPAMLIFPDGAADISVLNKKTWTSDQSTIFFPILGDKDFDIEQLSRYFLQGFTCGTVSKMKRSRVRQLIRACRPRKGRDKVKLEEPQLTCMYNLLRDNISQSFTDYPSDMLLYLNTRDVQKGNCRAYLSALGAADFTVASSILNKGSKKFSEAGTCLGISGAALNRDNVEVLGNMACSLEGPDIENSDPLILEKLKACKDLSDSQMMAVEAQLLSGKSRYGNVTTWTKKTLEDLDILPLYFSTNLWGHLDRQTKRRFLKGFMPNLRRRRTQKRKLKRLFKQLSTRLAKRAAGCNSEEITQVTISDPAFPFGYDSMQFDLCLDLSVLKENLYAICQKVDDDEFQKIILRKLNQTYPSGVPDQAVQLLASVSRMATLDDISGWSITKLDTLAALMEPEDGSWEKEKSRKIITKYLETSGNSLGSAELDAIGSNLCSLESRTLQNITTDSLRNARLIDVSSCSAEQKRVLYEISNSSYSVYRDNPITFYNLVKGYLGGAPQADIRSLSTQNISMSVNTFRSLDINVITNVTVNDVRGLMGENLPDLKLFENETVVRTWVNLQRQSDLDTLGVGLISNRVDANTTEPGSNVNGSTATTAPQNSTTGTNVTQNTTTGTNMTQNTANGTVTQGNTNSSSPASVGTSTPSQPAATNGVLILTKSPALVLLGVLLTAGLQILLQPA
ncbi:PREDICTED: uncharacterized protein LOC107085772 [Cyprinodon variegatus]|uniref:uncharacterized protein LOC107085772 n=1 Tax=Cyprinodon variegatus TaxID=28743 RepID=UPI000742CC2E|nr:PREDICTED: uncharacterized protein LOC107085772 [Cyprinodon variegatus]